MIEAMRTKWIAALFLLPPAIDSAVDSPARPDGISDGDTITVLAAGNRRV